MMYSRDGVTTDSNYPLAPTMGVEGLFSAQGKPDNPCIWEVFQLGCRHPMECWMRSLANYEAIPKFRRQPRSTAHNPDQMSHPVIFLASIYSWLVQIQRLFSEVWYSTTSCVSIVQVAHGMGFQNSQFRLEFPRRWSNIPLVLAQCRFELQTM